MQRFMLSRTALSRAAAALLCALLAACGSKAQGVLLPTGFQQAGTSKVEILVATTRSSEDAGPGEMFTGERAIGLNFADIAISIPPDSARQPGEIQWPSSKTANPATDFVTLRADRIDQPTALKRLYSRVAKAPQRRVLLFIHGYNTRFEESVYRFAQIMHDSKASVVPLLFTWPSRGQLLDYPYDHESATYSRDALEAILQTLSKDKSVGEISILAHSMGNWVAVEALRQMAIRGGGIAPKIKNVMLAAPDIDVDVFRRQMRTIGERHPPFTIFVSRDDKALSFSKRIAGSNDRLGGIDPEQEPYKSRLKELSSNRVTIIDLTDVQSGDSLGHTKFAQSPEVVQMIGGRLASGQKLNESGGFGQTLGSTAVGVISGIGNVTGRVVSGAR
ncbi:MAG: alpha/beta hydrolase [Beijerinckiaceae bacterium]